MDAIVPQMKKMMANLDHWLGKAEEHAKEKGFDPDRYATFRLAPDMYALTGQVQAACDTAKLCASRLSGKEAPKQREARVPAKPPGFIERRRNRQDRRKSVRDGVVVRLSYPNDRRVNPDRRRSPAD